MSEIFHSIFSSIEAFIYRCRNDADYTMLHMEGAVRDLTGYAIDDMVMNKTASWVGITYPQDVEEMVADIDAAINDREPWDLTYRVVRKDGDPVWVRERGNAVFENGELVYLQGMIVSAKAETSLRAELEDLVQKTQLANKEIVDLSRQITGSVKLLSLLSVNARIEAARSGPAGAGFAVVANEIKALADENGELAAKITEKLSASDPAPNARDVAEVSPTSISETVG